MSVLPECNSDSHCCANAILKSIAPYSGRKETAVYATDANNKMVIHCKVYIDNVSRIQIFRDSIKLDVDELATLRVRAFDSEGIYFSNYVQSQCFTLYTYIDYFDNYFCSISINCTVEKVGFWHKL